MKFSTIALGLLFPFALGAADKEQKDDKDKDKEPKLRLLNPGMEGGEGVPLGWTGKFGDCIVARDATVFHGGKASLCVDRSTLTDNRNACAHQMLSVKPASKITLSGWVRTEGTAKVNFAAQFFDERFTTNDCFPVKTLEGTHDWQELEAEIAVPENASKLAIALYVEGQGKAWLDDVKLKADGIKVTVVKPGAEPKAPGAPAEVKKVPVTAVPGYFPDRPRAWKLFHESQVRRALEGGFEVAFLGDSLTQGWTTTGREAWQKILVPLKSANFGLGGDTTGNLLWRLENGLLEDQDPAPKVVVLMVGLNNLWSGQNSGEEVVAGLRAVVEKLRSSVPISQILVVGLLPVGAELTDINRQRATEFNVLAAQLEEWNNVSFLNPGVKFLRRDGKLLEGLFQADNIHLTAKGYDLLAKELTPAVMELLKPAEPAAEPVKVKQELGPVGR